MTACPNVCFSWLNVGVRLNGSCVKGNVLNKFLTIIPLYLGQLLVDYVRLRFLRNFWFLHWHYMIWGRDRKCCCGWPENEAPKCWHQPDFCMCGGGEREGRRWKVYWLIHEGCFLKKTIFFVACSHGQLFNDCNWFSSSMSFYRVMKSKVRRLFKGLFPINSRILTV